MRGAHRLTVAGIIATASVSLCATRASAEWRRIDTPNFVIVGDVSPRTLRDVAMRFEGFRETLTRLLSERATTTAVPTVVVVFPSDKAFTPYKPLYEGKPMHIAGLFQSGRDLNHIALIADGNDEGVRIVFHEYAHLVISNLMRDVPPWLNEGLAEYYSTFELSDGGREALLGKFVPSHLMLLTSNRMLKLEELLNVTHGSPHYNEKNRSSIFYAQSWALVHRLLRGQPERVQELGAYLQALSDGMAPAAAWKQAFPGSDLERELAEYVRRVSFQAVRYKFSERLAKLNLAVTPVSPSEAQAYLAAFLVQTQRLDDAAKHAEAALKLAPDNAHAQTAAALHDVARSNYDAAAQRLLAITESGDWLVAYMAGIVFAEVNDGRGGALKPEQLASARAHFERVRRDRGAVPNALARQAMLEPRSSQPSPESRKDLELAVQMAPGREDYVFAYAQVLARMSEFGEARKVLGPMMSPRYAPGIREIARRLMGYVVGWEKALQSGSRAPGAQGLSAADFAAAAGETIVLDPGVPEVRPVYRELQPGEERVEGFLERIECSTEGAATLHVRTAEGAAQATAPRMDKVDFITYRDDLTGSVQCGPITPAPRVYLTWQRAVENGPGKVVVAVEFLPK